jgi:hypothetical protein
MATSSPGGTADLDGAGASDVGREGGREVGARHALDDRPVEKASSTGHREQRGDRSAAGGLAEDGHLTGVAAEGSDVVADPFQRGDLVEEATVGRHAVQEAETLEAHPVVDGHDDDAVVGEGGAVILGQI